jgi:hypothetical protein
MSTELEMTEGLVRVRVPLEPPPGVAAPADDWLRAEPLGSGRFRNQSCPILA